MSVPVELAPRHKVGLLLATPVMLAAGVAGFGDALASPLDRAALGGLVTAPVTRRPARGPRPRVDELAGGLLWSRGGWNPGLRAVLRDFAPLWRRSATPVVVHLGAQEPEEVAALAGALENTAGVAGLELDVEDAGPGVAAVWAARAASDLPLLVRIPLHAGDELVKALHDTPMDALVVAQPPAGLPAGSAANDRRLGALHGPLLAPLVAARVARLAGWAQTPLVACGGIHSAQDALALLAAGATAVQIDSAVWVDPWLPGKIATALAGMEAGAPASS